MSPAEAVAKLESRDAAEQNAAFAYLMEATDEPVTWAYEVWGAVAAALKSKDNRARAIASQVLSNLARSDPEQRILRDLDALLELTKDERFVTARHCLQSMWKIAIAGPQQCEAVVEGLSRRFAACRTEKNCTLIRYDILEVLRKAYDREPGDDIKLRALALIETEPDLKYRKKYASLWRKA